MQKIYFDAVKNLEICDVSGIKDIERLKKDFNAPGLVDVTAEREAKIAAEDAAAKINAPKEKLISDKIRAMAIEALQKEGKL